VDQQVPGELIIEFVEGTTQDEAREVIAEYGGELLSLNTIGTFAAALVRVPLGEETLYLNDFLQSPRVLLTELHYRRRMTLE
jgi:hypothetical protein